MPGPARGIIFDMDGVLVDSGAHHRAAWRALLDELRVAPGEQEFWRLTIGRPSAEAMPLVLGRAVDPFEAHVLARRKHEHYRRFARAGWVAIAGAPAFVALVVGRDVPCAVATSATRRDAARILQALDLERFLRVVVTADDVRWGKPHPEVYLKAADSLGLAPDACLVFEDSVVGVQAARTAGMRVIGLTTAHTAPELVAAGAERAIRDFEDATWPM